MGNLNLRATDNTSLIESDSIAPYKITFHYSHAKQVILYAKAYDDANNFAYSDTTMFINIVDNLIIYNTHLDDAIGATDNEFYCRLHLNALEDDCYNGTLISGVKAYIKDNADFELLIWEDETIVYNEKLDTLVENSWNDILISTPLEVKQDKTYKIGFHIRHSDEEYPIGVDDCTWSTTHSTFSIDGTKWNSLWWQWIYQNGYTTYYGYQFLIGAFIQLPGTNELLFVTNQNLCSKNIYKDGKPSMCSKLPSTMSNLNGVKLYSSDSK